jgi:hypothetical protein
MCVTLFGIVGYVGGSRLLIVFIFSVVKEYHLIQQVVGGLPVTFKTSLESSDGHNDPA